MKLEIGVRRLALAGAVLLVGCADEQTPTTPSEFDPAMAQATSADPGDAIRAEMAAMNARLAAEGANIRVEVAEIILSEDGPHEAGTTIYANNRQHQLAYHWVADDERRDADGNLITYLVDVSRSNAWNNPSAPAVINFASTLENSFAAWSALSCTGMQIVQRPDLGGDYSIVDDGVGQWWAADIVEAGFRLLGPNILGVTYTFLFTDDDGNLTDLNRDGRYDTALKEIWYSTRYYWTTNQIPGIDVMSVAIHENGHALEIGHFGKIFRTNSNGVLHFAPRAIMNAAYVSRNTDLHGTDVSSFCSNWGSWPN